MTDKIHLDSPYLSQNLKNEISSTLEGFDEFATYEPVLCAQEKPEKFEVKTLSTTDNLALVEISLDYFGQKKLINLELIKENEQWLIDQINCLQESLDYDELAMNYIINNISTLSPEPEVLGGTFYVTNIEKIGDQAFLVDYEDGHIALSAELEYEVNQAGEVNVYNFNIID
jgi:hypothetical protein